VAELDEAQEAELRFVGALVVAGCDARMLERLLAPLTKPYCYRLSRIYYDWAAQAWRLLPIAKAGLVSKSAASSFTFCSGTLSNPICRSACAPGPMPNSSASLSGGADRMMPLDSGGGAAPVAGQTWQDTLSARLSPPSAAWAHLNTCRLAERLAGEATRVAVGFSPRDQVPRSLASRSDACNQGGLRFERRYATQATHRHPWA
jgi:hypothetical protein